MDEPNEEIEMKDLRSPLDQAQDRYSEVEVGRAHYFNDDPQKQYSIALHPTLNKMVYLAHGHVCILDFETNKIEKIPVEWLKDLEANHFMDPYSNSTYLQKAELGWEQRNHGKVIHKLDLETGLSEPLPGLDVLDCAEITWILPISATRLVLEVQDVDLDSESDKKRKLILWDMSTFRIINELDWLPCKYEAHHMADKKQIAVVQNEKLIVYDYELKHVKEVDISFNPHNQDFHSKYFPSNGVLYIPDGVRILNAWDMSTVEKIQTIDFEEIIGDRSSEGYFPDKSGNFFHYTSNDYTWHILPIIDKRIQLKNFSKIKHKGVLKMLESHDGQNIVIQGLKHFCIYQTNQPTYKELGDKVYDAIGIFELNQILVHYKADKVKEPKISKQKGKADHEKATKQKGKEADYDSIKDPMVEEQEFHGYSELFDIHTMKSIAKSTLNTEDGSLKIAKTAWYGKRHSFNRQSKELIYSCGNDQLFIIKVGESLSFKKVQFTSAITRAIASEEKSDVALIFSGKNIHLFNYKTENTIKSIKDIDADINWFGRVDASEKFAYGLDEEAQKIYKVDYNLTELQLHWDNPTHPLETVQVYGLYAAKNDSYLACQMVNEKETWIIDNETQAVTHRIPFMWSGNIQFFDNDRFFYNNNRDATELTLVDVKQMKKVFTQEIKHFANETAISISEGYFQQSVFFDCHDLTSQIVFVMKDNKAFMKKMNIIHDPYKFKKGSIEELTMMSFINQPPDYVMPEILNFFSPVHLTNALHWYAQMDKGDGAFASILGTQIYLEDSQGMTPFAHAMKNKSFSAIRDLMHHLAETEETDMLHLTDFQLLIGHHSNEAVDIADKSFVPSEFINKYPKTLKLKDPKVFFELNSRILQKSDILKLEDDMGEHVEVDFETSAFRINTVQGSQDSLDLLTAILEIGNLDAFRTKLGYIVDWKWQQSQSQVELFAVPGFVLMIMTILDLIFLHGSYGFRLALLILTCFLLTLEFCQIGLMGLRRYVSDVQNRLDLIGQLSMIVYQSSFMINPDYVTQRTYQHPQYLKFFHLVALISILVRGISKLRVFDGPRPLINMIGAVIIDMWHFGLIFAYSVGCAFVIQWKIQEILKTKDSKELDWVDVAIASFSFSAMGDQDSWAASSNHWSFIFYVGFSVINIIVLLNLLISVISETYDRVQENQVASDSQERCTLMIEYEEFLVWKRDLKNFSYIHFCQAKSGDVVDSNVVWEGKIRAIKSQVNHLQQQVKSLEHKLVPGMAEINDKLDKLLAE